MFLTPHSHESPDPCDCRQYQGKFVRAVDQVLRSYQGRNLRSCKINFCLGSNSTDDIDRWISFAIGMGAEELSLGFYCDKMDISVLCDSIDWCGALTEGKYVFQLPNFEGSKANLKSLHLVASVLGQYSPDQFRCLQTLTVVCTNLAQYDLHGMFACLLTLKTLKFERCTLPEELSLSSLLQLEDFMIMFSEGLRLLWKPEALSWIPTHLRKCCPALQSLAICTGTDLVENMPPTTAIFSQVTGLCLVHNDRSLFGIVKINCILRAFPCLQELELWLPQCPDLEEGKAEPKEYVHEHLKRVVIAGFWGTSSEIECAIYLLTHTTVLERMDINPEISGVHPWALRNVDIALNKGEREKICERLQPFCKKGVLTVH
ncbi:hypothetical protein Tsubulata_045917 [Turnera subulata]|uniref:FBD domain-containing protein n=1 Tax=Turnera subulata TaxID=218843 RepID=A0A9Q0F1H9_9ROSI|nr:hypothetical protein Tsubulata_045917 [Turnera subulata]